MCVSGCVCMPYVLVGVGCVPMPVCGGLRSIFVVFPHHSPLLLRQGLSVNLKLLSSAKLTVQ